MIDKYCLESDHGIHLSISRKDSNYLECTYARSKHVCISYINTEGVICSPEEPVLYLIDNGKIDLTREQLIIDIQATFVKYISLVVIYIYSAGFQYPKSNGHLSLPSISFLNELGILDSLAEKYKMYFKFEKLQAYITSEVFKEQDLEGFLSQIPKLFGVVASDPIYFDKVSRTTYFDKGTSELEYTVDVPVSQREIVYYGPAYSIILKTPDKTLGRFFFVKVGDVKESVEKHAPTEWLKQLAANLPGKDDDFLYLSAPYCERRGLGGRDARDGQLPSPLSNPVPIFNWFFGTFIQRLQYLGIKPEGVLSTKEVNR